MALFDHALVPVFFVWEAEDDIISYRLILYPWLLWSERGQAPRLKLMLPWLAVRLVLLLKLILSVVYRALRFVKLQFRNVPDALLKIFIDIKVPEQFEEVALHVEEVADHELNDGALAGAYVSEDANELALLDLQVQILDGHEV